MMTKDKKKSKGLQEQNGNNPGTNLCKQCCHIPYIAWLWRDL